MDETQKLEDSFLEEEDEVVEEMDTGKEREPLAKLRVFNNEHFPETELPLFLGDNVLGRDPASCSLPLSARSVSKRHAVISIARLRDDRRRDDGATEALVWDLGSMNGTRKGRFRLTPHVRYALGEGDIVVIADLPCQFVRVGEGGAGRKAEVSATAETGGGRGKLRRIARGCVSDSDSEGEISVRKERRAKLFVPDSDSPRESSLSCSTFLTPTSRFVPDSEEESSITPSSSGRLDRSRTGKTPKHVSDSDPDDEEEEDEEEEAGTNSHVDCAAKTPKAEPSGAHPPVEPGRNEAEFKIRDSESDTDAEGEESVGNAPSAVGDKAVLPEAGPSTGPAARPEDFHLDSDTDVEDEADAAPASVPASVPVSVPARDQNAKPLAAVQQTDFHLDSDTDAEDQVEGTAGSAPGESAGPPEAAAGKPAELRYDSDTDAEDAGVEPEPPSAAAAQGLAILSDSDPDAEEDDVAPPCAAAARWPDSQTAAPGAGPAAAAARLESDSDTDLEEPDSAEPQPPAKSEPDPRDFHLDSDTDVEDVEDGGGAEGSAGLAEKPVSSTPRGSALEEGELETQPFTSTSDPFRRPSVPPLLKPKPLDDGQEDSGDEDLVFAPTQSFEPEGQRSSPAGDPALDATQPFSLDPSAAEGLEDQPTQAFSFQLGLSHCNEATQAYGPAESEDDSELEATQAYGEAPPTWGERERLEKEREAREEKERLEKDRKEREEKERLEKERKEREEKERLESEKKEREEKERLEKEKKENEEKERLEKERKEREEKERLEKEKKEKEEKERLEKEREEKERLAKERKEREEKERLESEKKEREEKERLEKERQEREEKQRLEKERKEREEKERLEREKKEREEKERLAREKKEREEKERLEKERKEREKKERLEKERKEREEMERLEKERKEKEKERLEKERKEREEKKRMEKEKMEREKRERLEKEKSEREEKERVEREKGEREEKERAEKEKREREERERLEKEKEGKAEKEQVEKERKDRQENESAEVGDESVPTEAIPEQGRRSRRSSVSSISSERSNSSTSVPARGRGRRTQRKTGSQTDPVPIPSQQEEPPTPKPGGRGRGRRSMKESASGSAGTERDLDSVRPDTVQKDDPNLRTPQGMNRGRRAIDSHPEASQSALDVKTAEPEGNTKTRGRSCKVSNSDSTATEMTQTAEAMEPKFVETPAPTTNRTRGRSRKVNDLNSTAAEVDQSTEILETPGVETPAPKENSRARGRSRKIGDSGSTITEVEQTTDSVQTSSVETPAPKADSRARGRGRKVNDLDSTSAETDKTVEPAETTNEETPSVETPAPKASVETPTPKANSRARGRGGKISDSAIATTEAAQTAEAVGTGAKVEPSKSTGRDRGQKRGLEVEGEEVSGSFKVPRGRSRRGGRGAGEQEEQEVHEEEEDTEPSPPLSKARGPSTQGKKGQQKEDEEAKGLSVQKMERSKKTLALSKEEAEEKDKTDEVQTEDAVSAPSSEEQDVPRTPTGRSVRKRAAPSESPSAAKTPRRSVASAPSPEAGGQSKAIAQAHKVLFTGLTDTSGEAVVARLGGSLAKGVNDMTHLVTDKVRRTVKFLCAVARGIPIVTTDWLEKSGRRGSFLPPSEFLVKDAEQEKKFSFRLEQSLLTAHTQPLLQGYEVHVTRSVKPDPAQMRDIISCSGARYLPKMPTVLKPQTVVVSCAEDASLCVPALSASIPVVSAEFLLTGILQQRADPLGHALSGPGFEPGAKGGAKGRKRK